MCRKKLFGLKGYRTKIEPEFTSRFRELNRDWVSKMAIAYAATLEANILIIKTKLKKVALDGIVTHLEVLEYRRLDSRSAYWRRLISKTVETSYFKSF